ncbi:MAG: VWA domain-containing protein, partial [Acidobacteriota bacterium]
PQPSETGRGLNVEVVMKLRGIALVIAFAGSAVVPVMGQDDSSLREQVEVTVVEIPVTVVDRAGEPVRGLKASDFELRDEGEKRPISYFETIDLADAALYKRKPLPPSARRKYLLLFDLSYTSPTGLVRAREAALDFVQKKLGEYDLASVATFSVERGFHLLTSFTTDRTLVASAVESLGAPSNFRTIDPLLISAQISPGLATPQTGTQRGTAPVTDQDVRANSAEVMRGNRKANENIERARIRRELESFGGVARALDTVHGQKEIILLSEGFDATLLHGREDLSSQESQADTQASTEGEIWKIDNDSRFGNSAATSDLTHMSEYFRRSDVVLHAVDVKGLRGESEAREGRISNSNEALFLLANGTGGAVFKNSNDLNQNFARILKRDELIYIVGFQEPPATVPGRFHNLKITLPGKSGLRVTHRTGYYETGGRANPIEQVLSATEILYNDLPRNEVDFASTAVPFPSSDGASVPVVMEIPGSSILPRASGDNLNGELFIYAFDRNDVVKDFIYQRIGLDLNKTRQALSESGLKYYGTLHLQPGAYTLKTLIRFAETGRDGFQRSELIVPDFSAPTVLPPMVMGAPEKWIMVRGSAKPGAPAEAYPFVIGTESFVPDPDAHYRGGEPLRLALFTYHLVPENLAISGVVAGHEGSGRLSLVGRTAVEEGRTKFLLSFDPGELGPGRYVLQLAVKEKAGQDGSVSVPFTVDAPAAP